MAAFPFTARQSYRSCLVQVQTRRGVGLRAVRRSLDRRPKPIWWPGRSTSSGTQSRSLQQSASVPKWPLDRIGSQAVDDEFAITDDDEVPVVDIQNGGEAAASLLLFGHFLRSW